MSEDRERKRQRPRRRRRRRKSDAEKTVDEVTDFIEDNPVTSAVAALAAGAVAASVFKMFVVPQEPADDPEPKDAD